MEIHNIRKLNLHKFNASGICRTVSHFSGTIFTKSKIVKIKHMGIREGEKKVAHWGGGVSPLSTTKIVLFET